MPKFLCLQRSVPGGGGGEKPSPAQMQAMYAKFNEWREKFQQNLVDLGGRLGAGRIALPDPIPDGPLIEVKELVGGYMVVSAASLGIPSSAPAQRVPDAPMRPAALAVKRTPRLVSHTSMPAVRASRTNR